MLSALTSNFPLLNEYEKEAENLEWKARVKNSSNISMRIIFPPVSISTPGEILYITVLYDSKNSEMDLECKRLKIPRIA